MVVKDTKTFKKTENKLFEYKKNILQNEKKCLIIIVEYKKFFILYTWSASVLKYMKILFFVKIRTFFRVFFLFVFWGFLGYGLESVQGSPYITTNTTEVLKDI